ncbi:MAG: DUF4282 domain-containing protein [Pseudomonadota bacterium]
MEGLFSRFLSFDKLIGASLIKIIYYAGLVLIAVWVLFFMFTSLGRIGNAPLSALGGFLLGPVFGAFVLLVWRFMCELYLLFFRMSEDIHELKAAMTKDDAKPDA